MTTDSPISISAPFLASRIAQLEATDGLKIGAVEAVLFDREDLEASVWDQCWESVRLAASRRDGCQVVFHFPVNDSDYVNDRFVRERLAEAWARCNDLGCAGMVVHSNQVRRIDAWKGLDMQSLRFRVVETLDNICRSSSDEACWLGLENMPLMDNVGVEIDPLFSFPGDFDVLEGTGIGITWDVCHYTNTVANVREVRAGRQSSRWYPHLVDTDFGDFMSNDDRIVHWHFSAFEGIADPASGTHCREGVRPDRSTLGEKVYRDALLDILFSRSRHRLMTLEIQEDDYSDRVNFRHTQRWIRSVEEAIDRDDPLEKRL